MSHCTEKDEIGKDLICYKRKDLGKDEKLPLLVLKKGITKKTLIRLRSRRVNYVQTLL